MKVYGLKDKLKGGMVTSRLRFWAGVAAGWLLCASAFASGAIATSHPLATQAGASMLRAGGSATDAAIAAQMVLTLVEPHASGLGGGALALLHEGGQMWAYDGRETAPAAADERLFLKPTGEPMGFAEAVTGGRAVGTPGLVRMLALMHQRHGRLPWPTLFEPAIELASRGFAVSPRLHAYLKELPDLQQDPWAKALYFDAAGAPRPPGFMLTNPELRDLLTDLAQAGPKAFYEGIWARAMVQTVRQHPTNPGLLTLEDLRHYRALERRPICVPHLARRQGALEVCGFPPPSSGGLAIAQMLGILSQTPYLEAYAHDSEQWLHGYTEAARLAYADRALYVGDPDFVSAPAGNWTSLLDPDYLKARAALIQPRSMQRAPAGQPRGVSLTLAAMPDQPEAGTSHMSIADPFGQSLALTTTIESVFGARVMVNRGQGRAGGFFLNNQLTDFSFVPRDAQGLAVANRVEPLKRPRSSMSPTLVLRGAGAEVVMNLGSAGGAHIIHYSAKTLLGLMHGGQSVQQAVDGPNVSSLNGPTLLERGRFSPALHEQLRARGAEVREAELNSGTQALMRLPDGNWQGGADARREGTVEFLTKERQ
jgi:gamma-glutamyltranspeptidase/glutathione hydrolase